MVTYKEITDGKKHIETIEDSVKKITREYDNKYKVRDFFKPSLVEVALFSLEIYLASFPIFVVTQISTQNPIKGAAYALVPQALTYIGARATELLVKNGKGLLGYIAQRIRDTKMPNPSWRIANEEIEYKDEFLRNITFF